MPVEIKELVVKVVVSDVSKAKSENVDAKLKALKADILKSCKKMIDRKSYGR